MRPPRWLPVLISLLATIGLEVSPIQSWALSAGMLLLSALLGVWWVWPNLRRVRMRSPIHIRSDDDVSGVGDSATSPAASVSESPVTFYEDRAALPQGGLLAEARAAHTVWIATRIGTWPTVNGVFRLPSVKRLILPPPDGEYVATLGRGFRHQSVETYMSDIFNTTQKAQEHGVEVRWCDVPIQHMAFSNPESPDASVRLEYGIPFADDVRPGATYRRPHPLYPTLLRAFNELWEAGKLPEEWARERMRVQAEEKAQVREAIRAELARVPDEATSVAIAPPDERFVILCRRYALPAYEAATVLVDAVLDECFKVAGWRGLAAHYFKYGEGEASREAATVLRECLSGTRPTSLDAEFATMYRQYRMLIGTAWQFGCDDIKLDQKLLAQWSNAHDAFMKELLDLAAGVNREALQQTLKFASMSQDMAPRLKALFSPDLPSVPGTSADQP